MATKEVKENEFGDKIGFSDVCAGILFWACAAGLVICACARGVQEIKKHKAQAAEKTKMIQIQNQR